ncbi:OmpA family protein [Solidesulfovibrio sp.]|uniref:OmpA/MotB family protein n=1 Tax=Solidesulfovibrio sp. TaxID=2910990 RepID=UPI00260B96C6|nr:OmpA family protein [Solidesulfovibrio sp.]
MRGRLLKVLMVLLVLVPVGLTAYLANNLYHRKGVPEALENLTKQLFRSKEEERKAEVRAAELERKADELQTAYDALVADLRGEVDSRDIRVRQFREKLEINFVDKVLFASGSAEITPHGREILLKVGGVLAKVKNKSIYVVGHTDSNPIHSALYPSNWELSTARSASVIRFLSEQGGLTPERFTAMGRAFYQPVASNATSEGRQENRRVDVIVADVPLLAGETGSETMRGTVDGEKKTPTETPAAGQEPLRESAPPPPPPAPDEPVAPAPATPPQTDAPAPAADAPPATPADPAVPPSQAAPAAEDAKPAPQTPAPDLPPALPDKPAPGKE